MKKVSPIFAAALAAEIVAVASARNPPVRSVNLLAPMLSSWIVFCHADVLWGRALKDCWQDLLVHLLCNHMSESLTTEEAAFLFAWTDWLLDPPCKSYILVQEDKPCEHVRGKMNELLAVHHAALGGNEAQLFFLKDFHLREIAKEVSTQ